MNQCWIKIRAGSAFKKRSGNPRAQISPHSFNFQRRVTSVQTEDHNEPGLDWTRKSSMLPEPASWTHSMQPGPKAPRRTVRTAKKKASSSPRGFGWHLPQSECRSRTNAWATSTVSYRGAWSSCFCMQQSGVSDRCGSSPLGTSQYLHNLLRGNDRLGGLFLHTATPL